MASGYAQSWDRRWRKKRSGTDVRHDDRRVSSVLDRLVLVGIENLIVGRVTYPGANDVEAHRLNVIKF